MKDIFLSYTIEDRKKAAKLAAVFKQEQWTVWLDEDPTNRILAEFSSPLRATTLKGAKVGVLLWSRATLGSLFSRRADLARRLLWVNVLLEDVRLPAKFSPFRSYDLTDWEGSASHAGLTSLLRHISALIAAPPHDSFGGLSLPKIQDSARLGIKEEMDARPEGRKQFKGVFISYRRDEAAAYAGRLYDRLAARFGKARVFIDTENVGWGEDFVEAITSAAESCAVMIVLISRGWSRGGQEEVDDYVRLEVAKALGRKIRVIPILIQGASMPAPKELPEDLAPLARRNALALSDTRWERDVEDLIKSLEKLL